MARQTPKSKSQQGNQAGTGLASTAISHRASLLARNIRRIAERIRLSKSALFLPLLEYASHATIYRLIGSDDWMKPWTWKKDEEHKRRWPNELLRPLAKIANAVSGYDEREIYDRLTDGELLKSPRLKILFYTQMLFERGAADLNILRQKLLELHVGAKLIVGWNKEMPARHSAETLMPGILRAKIEDLGWSSDFAEAKQRFALERFDDYLDLELQPKVRLGFPRESFEEIRIGTGHCRYVELGQRIEFFDNMREDAIDERGLDLIILRRNNGLNPTLRSYFAGIGGAYAIDNRVVVKMNNDGSECDFLERTGDPEQDRWLDHELALIDKLLEQSDLDPSKVHEELRSSALDVQGTRDRIREEKNERLRRSNPPIAQSMPSEKRFYLP